MHWARMSPLTLGLALAICIPTAARTQSKSQGGEAGITKTARGQQKEHDQAEISDRKLYSEVIFAEIFEKDLPKACKLLEHLLARKLDNTDLYREAQFRYQRLVLSSGQLDRYIAYLDKILARKDLKQRDRQRLEAFAGNLRGKWGQDLRKRVEAYKTELDKAKDKTPAEREAMRQKFLDSINGYLSRGRYTPREPEPGSREDINRRHEMRIRRAQDLQSRIDKLEKAGRGKTKEAQKLRSDLRRVIQEEESPQRGNRRGPWRGMGSMLGFYSARKKIEESGDTKRLAEFDKLRSELQKLFSARQFQKARTLLKDAEKRFPELAQVRRR